jgi:hypothetical protein
LSLPGPVLEIKSTPSAASGPYSDPQFAAAKDFGDQNGPRNL